MMHPCGVPVVGAVQPFLTRLGVHERKVMLLADRDGWWCHYCHVPLVSIEMPDLREDASRPPTIDHVVPRLAGGSDNLDNLVLACRACNSSKGVRPYERHLAIVRGTR